MDDRERLRRRIAWRADIGVATISNAAGMSGLATGSALGSATIQAIYTNVMGSAPLDVTP